MDTPCMSCGSVRNAKPRTGCLHPANHTVTMYTLDGTPVPVPGHQLDGQQNAECIGFPHATELPRNWPRPICGRLTFHERHSTPLSESPPTYVPEYDRWLERQELESASKILNETLMDPRSTSAILSMRRLLHEAGWRYKPHCGEGCTGTDCTTCHEQQMIWLRNAKPQPEPPAPDCPQTGHAPSPQYQCRCPGGEHGHKK